MNKTLRVILISIGAVGFTIVFCMVLLLCALAACDTTTTSPATEKVKTEVKQPVKTEIKANKKTERKIEVEVTADKIIKDYEENEIKADKTYKGKYAKITGGQVTSISETLGILSVNIAHKQYTFPEISLMLEDKHKNYVSELKKGDKVNIKGFIKGLGFNVDINDITFITN